MEGGESYTAEIIIPIHVFLSPSREEEEKEEEEKRGGETEIFDSLGSGFSDCDRR